MSADSPATHQAAARGLRRALWVVVAVGCAAGCSAVQRGQRVLTPLLEPAHRISRPLEHPLVDAVAERLLEAHAQAQRLQRETPPQRRLLLSPIAAAGTEWEASSLSWAVLRLTGALLPTPWPDVPQSPEAAQAWLRQETAQGRQLATELWLVQTRAGTAVDAELLIVRTGDIWRSGTEPLDVPAAERRSWLLTEDETPPTAVSEPIVSFSSVIPFKHLRERHGDVFLESRGGAAELRLDGADVRFVRRHEWDEWDMTWVERQEQRAQVPPPALALLSGDARLELHLTEAAPNSPQRWSWAMARGLWSAPLPLARTTNTVVMSIVAAPRAWGLHDAWLTLERLANAAYGDRLALYSAPLRALPEVPMWPAPVDTPAICLPVPAQSITVAPVVPAGQRGAALEDPWVAWRLVLCGVQLFHPGAPRDDIPEPGVRATSSEGGRRWELRLPQPGARAGLPAVHAEDWARAVRAALDPKLAVEGRTPQDDWLLGPLLGAVVEPTREGVRVTFSTPVPDFRQRLTHPRLALQDSLIASRFASHRLARPGRADLLLPRHRGLLPLQLVPTGDPALARTRFEQGQIDLLRPAELALDDPLTRAGRSAADSARFGFATTAKWNALREHRGTVALVFDPSTPEAMRRALADRVGSFTPHDLLAVEDSTLRPWPPVRVEVSASTTTSSGAPAASLRGVLLELSVDSLPEAQRAADRIAVLLQHEGVRTRVVDRAAAGDRATAAGQSQVRVSARLTPVPLFAEDPLLSALELRARVLPGQALPDDLRAAAQIDPFEAIMQRAEIAVRVQQDLIDAGLLVPLWTQPGVVVFDRHLGDADAPVDAQQEFTSLPLLLHEARWYDLPPPR